MNPCCMVTARSTSSRYPGKCFVEIADGLSAIQIVIRRALMSEMDVVLATGEQDADDQLAEIGRAEGVKVFRGNVINKVERWIGAARKWDFDPIIVVDGDDLTFNYDMAKQVLGQIERGSADLYKAPADIDPGFFTYAFTRAGMEKLYGYCNDADQDTDVLTRYVDLAGLVQEEVELADDERGHTVRMTLDYAEDVEFYRQLYTAIPWDAPGKEVVEKALETGIWEVNWARHADHAANQASFNDAIENQ
jgi:spore coat polysaccharide biosynthesis protein SpsF (cytidylyltransferase family)